MTHAPKVYINGIDLDHNYLVKIPVTKLKTFEEIDQRFSHICTLIDWLNELTEWQNTYSHHIGRSHINIWFKFPEHAIMCSLKWL